MSEPESHIEPAQLRHLAFNGRSLLVYRYYAALDPDQALRYRDPLILSQAILGAIESAREKISLGGAAGSALTAFVERVLRELAASTAESGDASVEYFRVCRAWAHHLAISEDYSQAARTAETTLVDAGAELSDVGIALRVLLGESLVRLGAAARARSVLGDMADRPYRIQDRALVARISLLGARLALSAGDARGYERLAWRALRAFHVDDDLWREATRQIGRGYRGPLGPLFCKFAGAWEKFIYGAALAHLAVSASRVLRAVRLDRATRLAMLGTCYAANYWRSGAARDMWIKVPAPPGAGQSRGAGIIVTRAMGGLGDLLMMTPGLRALKRKHPEEQIHFAIPGAFHVLFEGNTDISLLDIRSGDIDLTRYSHWYDLTDCPASRVETRSAPNVKRNRIEIFASAMGISPSELDGAGRTPVYVVKDEEADAAKAMLAGFRRRSRLVGVQIFSAETYRDYRHMALLVDQLAHAHDVLVFHGRKLDGFDGPGIFKCEGLPLRKSVALLAQCDAFVGPDSSFIHFAAALGLPALGIYGPIDGRVRTADYPKCSFIDARAEFKCIPCWRNESIMCRLTGERESVCMGGVPVERVLSGVQEMLSTLQ